MLCPTGAFCVISSPKGLRTEDPEKGAQNSRQSTALVIAQVFFGLANGSSFDGVISFPSFKSDIG